MCGLPSARISGQIDHHPAEPPGRDYYAHHNPAYFGPRGDVPGFYCKEKPILMKLAYLVGFITFLGPFFGMPALSLVLSQLTRCRDYRHRPSRLRLGSLWAQGRPRAQQHRRTAGFLLGHACRLV